MLRKLMKHEFRATGRVMLPLFLVVLLASVGGNVSLRLLDASSSRGAEIVGGLLMSVFTIAVAVMCVESVVLMVQRFRRNLMGDEGYISLTLPASIHQQLWAKLLVSSVWFILTGVMAMVAVGIMAFDVDFLGMFMRGLSALFSQLTAYLALNGAAICVEMLALVFLGCVAMCLQFYAAISIGNSFANHKSLLSVVFFFGLQFAVQVVGSIMLNYMDFSWIDQLFSGVQVDAMGAIHLMMAGSCALVVLYGAVFYVITAVMLKKRLNLE